jgi:hypothetical protein
MSASRRNPGRYVGIAMLVVLVAGIIVQIVNQNVTNNESDWTRYGRLSVPASGVFKLPGGSVDLILQDDIDNGISIPAHLAVSVKPVGGAPPAVVTRNVGQQFGSGSYGRTQSLKRVWRVRTPSAGRYRIAVGGAGSDTFFSLDIGHAPALGAVSIWLWVLIGEAILVAVGLTMRFTTRRNATA